MKLTKQEAQILLWFADGNRDCDLDIVKHHVTDDLGGHLLEAYAPNIEKDLEKKIKKFWASIIKKLRSVK